MANKSKKTAIRHPIDTLRVKFWYSEIEKRTGCLNAYQLDKHFGTDSIWHHYKNGEHMPRKLVDLIDAEHSGTASLLNNPLWDVLKLCDQEEENIKISTEKFDPEIILILTPNLQKVIDLSKPLPNFSNNIGHKLMNQYSLSALAALLVYWLNSQLHNRIEDAQLEVRYMFKILIMIAAEMTYDDKMIVELYRVFRTMVFEKTNWGYRRFDMDDGLFSMSCIVFGGFLLYEVKKRNAPVNSYEEMCKIEKLTLGLDFPICVNIFLNANWYAGPPTEEQLAALNNEHLMWLWSWLHFYGYSVDPVTRGNIWKNLVEQKSKDPIGFRLKVDSVRSSMVDSKEFFEQYHSFL